MLIHRLKAAARLLGSSQFHLVTQKHSGAVPQDIGGGTGSLEDILTIVKHTNDLNETFLVDIKDAAANKGELRKFNKLKKELGI